MTDQQPEVPELLLRAVRAGAAPGASAEWGRDGAGPSQAAVGAARLFPQKIDAAVSTWFDLASLTKPLVTTTLTILAFRSGSLRPSTRVGEVLLETNGSAVGSLMVEDLLTHTAGLPAWLPLYCLADGERNSLVRRLAAIDPEAPAGAKVIYSCVGFVILGLMLARIADQTLDGVFERQVLEPLGLENELGFKPDPATHSLSGGSLAPVAETRLVAEMGCDPNLVPAVDDGLPDDGNARFLDGVAGNAGLFGTAGGVGALAAEYLPGGGELLSEAEAAEATRLHTGELDQARSWGWQLGSSPGCSAGASLSSAAFGHTGFTGVSAWCEPARRGVFVLLTNRNHPWQRETDLHPVRRRFHAVASGSLERHIV
jgi:CubicO group peptidase (beta-lactamase class C family)